MALILDAGKFEDNPLEQQQQQHKEVAELNAA
jgi:hypothetical protein